MSGLYHGENMFSVERNLQKLCLIIALLACCITGCRAFLKTEAQPQAQLVNQEIQNPVQIPLLDRFEVMEQISDELDDYFRIAREEQLRIVDNVVTEGWIETWPRIGSTILEPWHHDSTRGFEKLHASLQTVRRQAKVRVIPSGDSFLVDVKVFKELEDNPNPVRGAVSGRHLRHDNALDVGNDEFWSYRQNDGWISMGRDISLEQRILANIVGRLSATGR